MVTVTHEHKRTTLLRLLEDGVVMLHLDPRREGVVVPERFRGDVTLRLNVAWGFRLPAFEIDHAGVYAVLSFNRLDFGCTLPWDAIFAMTLPDDGHRGAVWPESLPPEIAASAAGVDEVPRADGDVEKGVRIVGDAKAEGPKRPVAVARPAPKAAPPRSPAPPPSPKKKGSPPPPAPGPGRGHLRLVKG